MPLHHTHRLKDFIRSHDETIVVLFFHYVDIVSGASNGIKRLEITINFVARAGAKNRRQQFPELNKSVWVVAQLEFAVKKKYIEHVNQNKMTTDHFFCS